MDIVKWNIVMRQILGIVKLLELILDAGNVLLKNLIIAYIQLEFMGIGIGVMLQKIQMEVDKDNVLITMVGGMLVNGLV
jgi:hypothetical protein